MKSSFLFYFGGFAANLYLVHTAPTDLQERENGCIALCGVCPCPVATPASASKYPKPTTNEFKYENFDQKKNKDKGDQFIIHSAFQPYSSILAAALSSVGNTDDKTIARWFPPKVTKNKDQDARAYVGGVIRRMFKAPDSPQDRIADIIADAHDYGKTKCDSAGKTRAYFTSDQGRFHVCQPGLDQPMIADAKNCSSLGDKVSKAMQSLSGTLIHEFTHWKEIGDKAPDSVGHITDIIYGPSNCFRMAHAPSNANNQKAFINADSYKWFALNAFYNKVCNKEFGDPAITQEDFDEGEAELMASPEYNPVLSSGSLEGI